MSSPHEVPTNPHPTPEIAASPQETLPRSRGRALPVFGGGAASTGRLRIATADAVTAPAALQAAAPQAAAPQDAVLQAAAPQAVAPQAAARHPLPQPLPEPEVRRRHLSIAAMVIGIVSLLLSLAFIYSVDLGLLPAAAAVIVGHRARKRQPWAKPLWMTGLITGYVALGIGACWIALIVYVIGRMY